MISGQKLLFTMLLACGLFVSAAAGAQGRCYSQAQVEAEQGLRIHSELMVIALTCMKSPGGGQHVYDKYLRFTSQNRSLINGYENTMLAYHGSEENLNNLKTKLANKISQSAITMSVASFCQKFGTRVDQALAMDQGKLRRWASQVWPQSPTTQPMCQPVQMVRGR